MMSSEYKNMCFMCVCSDLTDVTLTVPILQFETFAIEPQIHKPVTIPLIFNLFNLDMVLKRNLT